MNQYHKIQSVYKRDPKTKYSTFLVGEWSRPEFGYLANNEWIWTEKIDGTNIRIMWNGKETIFGGKTDNAQIPSFLVNRLVNLFKGDKKKKLFLEKFGEEGNVCLYGEGCGKKIQKGGGNYYPNGNDFVLFDVKIGDWWLKRKDVKDIAKYFNIKIAPVVGIGTIFEAIEKTKKGFNSQWGDFIAEGMVLRPKIELLDRGGRRIITKLKIKDFKNETSK